MPHLPSISGQMALGPALRLFPVAGNALLQLRSALLFAGAPLSEGECELIATYVSALNGCDYCVGSHRGAAEAQGITPLLLDDIVADPAAARDAEEAALFALLGTLTHTPSSVRPADVEAVRATGRSDDEIAHAVQVCAFFNGMNRIAEGLGLEREPRSAAHAAQQSANRGAVPADATAALLRYHDGLMLGPSPLSIGERATIAAYVSVLNGCEAGVAAHRAAALRDDLTAERLDAVIADPDAAPEAMQPLLRYMHILSQPGGAVAQADVDAMFAAGWSEEALFHAISVCALSHQLDRLTACPGIAPDPRVAALYAEH
ncbi:MAG: peroxidase-related enzyme [Parasphingopyxis sp.]|uniref:carboxymuconolactone decarboxylase family protein n=1 Tax=Parasphingopyxis sp. TaxID=1920299 RepID=UPI0032EFB5C3